MARAMLCHAGMKGYDTDKLLALDWDLENANSTDEELEIEFTPEQEPAEGDVLEWDGASWVVVNE